MAYSIKSLYKIIEKHYSAYSLTLLSIITVTKHYKAEKHWLQAVRIQRSVRLWCSKNLQSSEWAGSVDDVKTVFLPNADWSSNSYINLLYDV